MRPAIAVQSETLPGGAVPALSMEDGWPYPIYAIHKDGTSIVEVTPSGGHHSRVFLPEFEWSSNDREECSRKTEDAIRSMCDVAGHAGRAYLLIRSDYFVGGGSCVTHVLNASLMFTMDWLRDGDPDLSAGREYPVTLSMGPRDEELHELADVARVMMV